MHSNLLSGRLGAGLLAAFALAITPASEIQQRVPKCTCYRRHQQPRGGFI